MSEDPLHTLRRIELVAVVAAALFCLQLAYAAYRLAALEVPAAVVPAGDSLQVPAVLAPALLSADDRNAIITRPLFWSSREPAEMVATLADPEQKPGELKDVHVVGVFGSGDSDGIIALVKNSKRRILVGEALEGWTLESVDTDAIVFSNGGRRETLVLQRAKAAPAASAQPVNRQARSGSWKSMRSQRQEPAKPAAVAAPVQRSAAQPAKSPATAERQWRNSSPRPGAAASAKTGESKEQPSGAGGQEAEPTLGLGPRG